MTVISSKAIVISTIKYSDTSLIVRLYTEEVGLVSFLLKGVLKSKKGKLRTAYFQPLNQLSIIFSLSRKKKFTTIKRSSNNSCIPDYLYLYYKAIYSFISI